MPPSLAAEPVDDALLRGWPLPVPGGGDKNARGGALVVAGAPQMPGAAILCAIAVLRSGAGKVQVGTPASVAPLVGAGVLEALVVALDELPSGAIAKQNAPAVVEHANALDALVIGPALVDQRSAAALTCAVLSGLEVPAVVDAAALACVNDGGDALRALGGRALVTPHCGEMASMLRVAREEVERDPARYALDAARRFGAVVALKGERTFIAAPDGTLYRSDDGDIGLATAGSGDVLAGIAGGLLARGAPPLQAAVWAVALHARAGARLSQRVGLGFLARELPGEIPVLLRELADR
ncbi:MAG TPA: NAD(P)H-hydrate dehydratase [Candidatus Elarobacter sp.]|jgi:hydroxyethylthiazole kinase-like uncharacterized protein yjeF|nr:NAD(P)H-hydrate dehydratase [Candidatus Elarobacter sp.]